MMMPTVFAAYYVDDPNNCPTSYLAQGPIPGNVVCGETGGTVFFSTPASIVAPTGTATSNTNVDSGFDGGYLIDCYDYNSPAPFCMPADCDRNSTCYSSQVRDTTCSANVLGLSTCGNCRSGYDDCSGDVTCETQLGVTACAM